MKKQVTYNYKLKMEKGSGSPVNSQCECPAGKGPHATCKHIAAVLLMLEEFSQSGQLAVEKSCTEGLQTFNQPRAYYTGKPLKLEDIPLKRKLGDDLLSDPRPEKYRRMKDYTDYVRNTMVNYCAISSKDIAMRYLFPRANLLAAQHDHHYLKLPFAEHWVDEAVKVTEKEAQSIEKTTRGQSNNKEWFKARQWRVTASRFGEVTKITARRNIKKLCDSLHNPKPINKPQIFHGKMYESKALTQFKQNYKMNVVNCGLIVSHHYPFLGASPDGLVGADSLVEVKCPYSGRNEKILPGSKFKFLMYERDGTMVLRKSSPYYDQIQGQLFLCKRKYCFFVVYTFVDLFVQKIEINHDYCVGCLIPKLQLFYTRHFRPYIATLL
ncbi:uncharacterized protein LOC143063144 [Mytilus galloprovincialis]